MTRDHESSRSADHDVPNSRAGSVAAGKRTRTEDLVQRAASSPGAPLPDGVRARFEGSLGADLSGVRVHTGGESAMAARAIHAQAYATGNDIHFASGRYQPDDPFGLHLLAHEVAHTVQQGGATVAGPQRKAASAASAANAANAANDTAERDADRTADAMVRGERTSVGRAATDGTVQCFLDDLIDAASDAVSGAADAVANAFSGGGEAPASEAAPAPAPETAPTPVAPARAPAKPRYDQHLDAEHRTHQRDRETPADHHAYDHTQEYEHRRSRRGGDDEGGEPSNHGNHSNHDEVPADELQARRQAYRERLRAQDAEDPNYVEANQGEVTRQDVYHALSRLGPSYPRDFKALMVGHSFGEQGGRNVVHFNYMGVELWRFTRPANDKRKFTRALRSDIISPAEYHANPDYFWDWKDSGKGTIQQQLAKGATRIYCLYPGPRAVFSSVDDASKSFWHTIVGWRLKACQSSPNPAHQALAQGALAGDVEAYIQMVELNDATIKVKPYNGNKEYPSIVRPHLRHALADASLND